MNWRMREKCAIWKHTRWHRDGMTEHFIWEKGRRWRIGGWRKVEKRESKTGEKDRKREKLVQHFERNLLKEEAGKSWVGGLDELEN